MKKDLSACFSAKRFSRWSYKKLLAAGALALAVLCGSVGAAVPAIGTAAGLGATPVPTAAPTPEPTPNYSLLQTEWKQTLRPIATPTPIPDVELVMELSGKSQAIAVDVFRKEEQENGKTTQKALTGVELEIVIVCQSLDELEDESNEYKAQQSRVGAIGK